MRSSLFVLPLFGLAAIATACINISDVTLGGKKSEIGEEALYYNKASLIKVRDEKPDWASRLTVAEIRMKTNPTTRDRSDYGGVLVHMRQFEKGRDVLLEAERLDPSSYAVASNLGTAYELLGNDTLALEWIRKGMERNPKSHQGTEWVHVKILEAKLALKSDPAWLETHSVAGLDFGSEPAPRLAGLKDDIRTQTYRLITSLGYQLHERVQFVKAPDPVVGDLLFDLANTMAVHGGVSTAVGLYELAKEYGAPRRALLESRLTYAKQIVTKAQKTR